MPQFRFKVNGRDRVVDTQGERPLLDVLREDMALTGTKYGCGEGQCRACTVLIDGRPSITCVTPVGSVAGKSVVTVEGLAGGDRLHRVQQAFITEGAMQCGYCVPGMVLRTVALLDSNPHPNDEEIVTALDGSLCRCCGYARIVAAVRSLAEKPAVSRSGGEA